jgi:TonB family protein
MDIPPTDILVPALPLPQGDTAPRFAGDATLTQARGGDGNPNGRGAGFGYGSGDGTGTGGAGRAGEARKAQEGAPKEWGVLQKVQAHYPPLALKYRVQGYVVVRVTVDENGVPIKVQPVRGSDLLMPECLRVLALWRFEPPGKYGLSAPVSFPVVYKFEIDT